MADKSSPFKFLDPYTSKDKDIFFGRKTETDKLYEMVFQTNLILVYGQSGTGKTSLVQCGLANRFESTDWMDIFIRRKKNINDSFRHEMLTRARTSLEGKDDVVAMVESLYLDFFKPIYLIFDQFEELFILGTKEEQDQFIDDISKLLATDLNFKIIIVMREEYIAMLYDFEQKVPAMFQNRLRVETMSMGNIEEVIINTCAKFNIELEDNDALVTQIIKNISSGKSIVQLSYLQVYLDRLYKAAKN